MSNTEKYITTVATVKIIDKITKQLFAYASLQSSNFAQTVNNVDIRGGVDAMLKLVFSNQKDATLTLQDVEYKLETIALQNNVPILQGSEFFGTEGVTITNGTFTVSNTPLAQAGSQAIGWVSYTDSNGNVVKNELVTFSGKTAQISNTGYTGDACVDYVRDELNSRKVAVTTATKNRQVIVIMDFRETLKEVGETTALVDTGIGQLYIPNAIILQNSELAFTMDAASTQQMTIRALSNGAKSVNCQSQGEDLYEVREFISSGNWYDNVTGIGIEGGDDIVVAPNGTATVNLTAFKNDGTTLTLNTTDRLAGLTISTSDENIATANGNVITGVAVGSTQIKFTITDKPKISNTVNVTVETPTGG